jgi:hypothetical protein
MPGQFRSWTSHLFRLGPNRRRRKGFLLRHLPPDSGLLCSQPFLSARGEHFDASTPNHASSRNLEEFLNTDRRHGKRIVRAPWGTGSRSLGSLVAGTLESGTERAQSPDFSGRVCGRVGLLPVASLDLKAIDHWHLRGC